MPLEKFQLISGPGNAAGRVSLIVPAGLEIYYNKKADMEEGLAIQLYINFGPGEESKLLQGHR
jgi:hypothetical protein